MIGTKTSQLQRTWSLTWKVGLWKGLNMLLGFEIAMENQMDRNVEIKVDTGSRKWSIELLESEDMSSTKRPYRESRNTISELFRLLHGLGQNNTLRGILAVALQGFANPCVRAPLGGTPYSPLDTFINP